MRKAEHTKRKDFKIDENFRDTVPSAVGSQKEGARPASINNDKGYVPCDTLSEECIKKQDSAINQKK